MRCLGYERKQGTFTDDTGAARKYDNLVLQLAYTSPKVVGEKVTVAKVSAARWSSVCACEVGDCVGQELSFEYVPAIDGKTAVLASIEVL